MTVPHGTFVGLLEDEIAAAMDQGDTGAETALRWALEAFRDTFGITGATLSAQLRRPR